MTSASCCVSSGELSSWLPLRAQKTSLEEASNFIGVPIPVPTYLPKGCKIQEVFIEPFYERPSGSRITLLISDKKIEKEITTHVDNAGRTQQRYEFKCRMQMRMWWSENGGPGKPPCGDSDNCKLVDVGEGKGWLADWGAYRQLWFWPHSYKPGFEIVLSAGKRMPKEELIKVAESMTYVEG